MGRPKLTLPLGGRTILEHTIGCLAKASVSHILVVVGPHFPELAELASAAGAEAIQLDCDASDMRATVMLGLQFLEEKYRPRPDDRVLLVPADHPAVHPEVIVQLHHARRAAPGQTIVVPTFGASRG